MEKNERKLIIMENKQNEYSQQRQQATKMCFILLPEIDEENFITH